MSSSLAAVHVRATFCFAWLYSDIVSTRNQSPESGSLMNRDLDTGIETFQQIIADGHELAYHTHPPKAVADGGIAFYARPNTDCTDFDRDTLHRWRGLNADWRMDFFPGVYEFDDPHDPWCGPFTWQHTSESLFLIVDYLGVSVRHTNGGERPLLDLTNEYGEGINHEHCLRQVRSLMERGFDLISPEAMPFFSETYEPTGPFWSDPATYHASYFGPDANVQVYYPDIDGARLERATSSSQGLTFMPVQKKPQGAWMSAGQADPQYYDAEAMGGTGGGGKRWGTGTFYSEYFGHERTCWSDEEIDVTMPSLADQFNAAMRRHLAETPGFANAWGFDHHVVNVMWANVDPSGEPYGLSDNWDLEIRFIKDIADGVADGIANAPSPGLVRFVTMQELSAIYDGLLCQYGR